MPGLNDKFTVEKITSIQPWVEHKLFSFTISRPPGFRFKPGQFARLGLIPKNSPDQSIVWRAYSMVSADYDEELEFYSIVVENGAFTSQLAQFHIGDTVFLDKTAYGFLTTDEFGPNDTLWLLASGTGLAPFLSILADARPWQHYKHIILVHSVREAQELTYQDKIQALTDPELITHWLGNSSIELPKFSYVPIVTREALPNTLNQRITKLIDNGRLSEFTQTPLDPQRSHVMICGNPDMLKSLRAQLKPLGFQTARRGIAGNLALENYW